LVFDRFSFKYRLSAKAAIAVFCGTQYSSRKFYLLGSQEEGESVRYAPIPMLAKGYLYTL